MNEREKGNHMTELTWRVPPTGGKEWKNGKERGKSSLWREEWQKIKEKRRGHEGGGEKGMEGGKKGGMWAKSIF